MTEPQIICPNCSHEIKLTESLAAPLIEETRKRFADAPDDFFIKPASIAEEIWHVVHQERSAWSFNVEVRPFRETW